MTAQTPESLRDRYLAAQLAGDRRQALALLLDEGIDAGLSPDEMREVVRQAQAEIGSLWAANRISVAQEHMATAISQLALSHLYDRAEIHPPNGSAVLVACVEGELHEFPARLAADALDLAGFSVRYLGADVPTESLLDAVEREAPDLVALSCTIGFHLDAAARAVARLRDLADRMERPPLVAVGGGAAGRRRDELLAQGADLVGEDARELVEAARRQIGAPTR